MLVVVVVVLVIAIVVLAVLAAAALEVQALLGVERQELQILAAAVEARLVDYRVLILAVLAVLAL
jgi:hypothetical protein